MSDAPDPLREALKAEPLPPIVPHRLRRSLAHIVENAIPEDTAADLGRWLFEHRDQLVRYGDDEGREQFGFVLPDTDAEVPAALLAPLRAVLTALPAATLDAIAVPAFDLPDVTLTAALHHHGGHCEWTRALPDPSRRVAFCLFLHSLPKMFSGGDLEFTDGRTIEPAHRRLVVWHPAQTVRLRRVECWSAHVLHGCWMLSGWVHGPAPDGWADTLARVLA